MTETTTASQNGIAPVEEVLRTTETAVLELVHGSVRVTRTLLPDVITRPTVTVDRVFDVAERVLASSRRGAHAVAAFIESGFDGAERWAD